MAISGDFAQVLVNGYELTGDMNRIDIEDSRKLLPAAAFGDMVEKYLPGQRSAGLSHQGFMNAASAHSHAVLKGLAVDGVIAILLGQNAQPALGDPVYHLLARQAQYRVSPQLGEVIPFRGGFSNQGDVAGWGQLLLPASDITNTYTGSNLDNGASSSNGGAAFLQVLEATLSDSYTVEIEGSANGVSAWGQVAEFQMDGLALGSEALAIVGSIPRYLRVKATRFGTGGDDFRLAVSIIRF